MTKPHNNRFLIIISIISIITIVIIIIIIISVLLLHSWFYKLHNVQKAFFKFLFSSLKISCFIMNMWKWSVLFTIDIYAELLLYNRVHDLKFKCGHHIFKWSKKALGIRCDIKSRLCYKLFGLFQAYTKTVKENVNQRLCSTKGG